MSAIKEKEMSKDRNTRDTDRLETEESDVRLKRAGEEAGWRRRGRKQRKSQNKCSGRASTDLWRKVIVTPCSVSPVFRVSYVSSVSPLS